MARFRGGARKKYEGHLPRMQKLFEQGWSMGRIAEEIGCSRPTVRNYLFPEQREIQNVRVLRWLRENPDERDAAVARYRIAHPEARLHARSVSRVRQYSGEAAAQKSMFIGEFRELYYADDACPRCGRTYTDELPREQHHLLAISKGGLHVAENMVIICDECHDECDPKRNLGRKIVEPPEEG